jgi:hypothetical protein
MDSNKYNESALKKIECSYLYLKPIEANWTATRAAGQNNYNANYLDKADRNRQQDRTTRFNCYCNYCDKF